jgi:hypothetical protein
MRRIALIDGDVLAYRCGFAAQHKRYMVLVHTIEEYGPIFESSTKKEAEAFIHEAGSGGLASEDAMFIEEGEARIEPLSYCLHTVKQSLYNMVEATDAEAFSIHLSPSTTFRHQLATIQGYKANRKDSAKPVHLAEIRNYLQSRFKAKVADNMEADDAISIAAHELARLGDLPIVCSNDKDLQQIPGMHYNFATKDHDYVSPERAVKWFYEQVLQGDATDNVLGIPGVGPVKAHDWLVHARTVVEMWQVCVNAFADHYGDMEGPGHALETARLVYILQKEKELWQPPK